MKEGLCDRSTAPSVSAISRLLRGKSGECEGDGKCFICTLSNKHF